MLSWSAQQVHVREATGRNDGAEVEAYQRVTGNKKRAEWCGSFQGAGQQHCGLPMPAGAGMARAWFRDPVRTYLLGTRGSLDSLRPGHQVGFFSASRGVIGHVGRAVRPAHVVHRGRLARRSWYCSEGNTGIGTNSGVHVILRAGWEIYGAANWLY